MRSFTSKVEQVLHTISGPDQTGQQLLVISGWEGG